MIKINGTNVTIMVMNMDKAISFYESIGLKLQNRWGDHYAMMTTTSLTIGLHPAEKEIPASSKISIGFMVDQADEAKELLEKNNIPYKHFDDKSGVYLNFNDPDGTTLYFTQPKWSRE
jgi:predicted enzyme related to lactoylglutathione lyase